MLKTLQDRGDNLILSNVDALLSAHPKANRTSGSHIIFFNIVVVSQQLKLFDEQHTTDKSGNKFLYFIVVHNFHHVEKHFV